MQKARRHQINWLRPLVGSWFQGLFHSLVQGSFHLSLTVLVHYRSLDIFSLTRWFWQIHAGFHMSRATQDTDRYYLNVIQDYHLLGSSFPADSDTRLIRYICPTTPKLPKQLWFGLFPVRSPLLRESLLFSFPPGT